MEFLTHPVVAAVILLGLLVFVHEFGHYLVGVWCGARAEIFSIGFGPKILGWKVGPTDFRLGLIPLGGFVKFAGSTEFEDVPPEHRGKEFYRLSKVRRSLIIAAGPAANLLLAVSVYAGLGFVGRAHNPAIVGMVRTGSPASQAGVQSGDRILSINQVETNTFDEVRELITKSAQRPMEMTVSREGEQKVLTIIPDAVAADKSMGESGDQGRIGIGVGFRQPVLAVTDPNGPAARIGFQTGDKVLRFIPAEGAPQDIRDFDQMQRLLLAQLGTADLQVVVDRQKQEVSLDIAWQTLGDFTREMLISPHHGVLPSGDLVIKGFQEHAYPDLMVGDRILALAGKPMMDIFTFADVLSKQTEPGMDVTVERAGQKLDLKVELNSYEVQKPIGKVTHYQLSLEFVSTLEAPEPYVEQYRNPLAALSYGVKHTVEQSTVLFRVLGGLLSGDVPLKVLGGPVMIAKFAGDAAKAGLEVFFTMMALISVNLAVVNLLPIPILDGGQLVWIGLEGLKGRRLDRKAFENFQKIGFVLVLFLMVVATYNDFSRFWAEMLRGLKGLF